MSCALPVRSSFVSQPALSPSKGSWSLRVPRGFTLLEILLSLAIIALIGTVLIGGSAQLLSEHPASPDEVFDKAVQEARKTALKSEKPVRLVFKKDQDQAAKRFAIVDSAAPPYGHTRRLITAADVKGDAKRAHSSVVPGGAAVKNAAGGFIHEAVWRYLFTQPVDEVGAPVPTDPAAHPAPPPPPKKAAKTTP